jgi:DNA recombination protein Rad52
MSDFSNLQLRKLKAKLDRRNVHSREVEGRSVDYIEGWFAIAQANAIFGFGGWDREMTHFERIYERTRGDSTSCAYCARVRIRVRAGRTTVLREGSGCGSATASTAGEAHDMALKAAETDATKRALATFGNSFGLGLYDKEQNGVTGKKSPGRNSFVLYDPTGAVFAGSLSPESFCSGLRQLVEASTAHAELQALALSNNANIARLRTESRNLKTARNIHYADVLERLIEERLRALSSKDVGPPANGVAPGSTPHPSSEQNGHSASEPGERLRPNPRPLRPARIAYSRIDKSLLAIGTERRLRDKAHLLFVATQPCLICGREPTHAHPDVCPATGRFAESLR